ncbi:hypothetical protein M0813_12228 [Anaeramoeba flamelloides]|uniref:Uncharacterized protein n=1 Tax=Anaeramoeba flamelloides TaxID=1746091 RepID=A0ABQ8ZCN4_9EUKA|nr:hypothetical protein M0813_12228 [Anaeramoeba flamelloides]
MRSRLKWCPKTRNTPKQFNTRSKFAGLEREDPHWKSKLLYKLGIHIPSIQILSENKRWAKKKNTFKTKKAQKEKLTKEKQKNRADGGVINRCSGRRKDRGGEG